MGLLENITEKEITFIEQQKMFFVATAPVVGRINLSPKGMDSFRVMNENRVIWLNLTGSGNETQAHLDENGRMTIMFCSFEKTPNILRLYGKAKAIMPKHKAWKKLSQHFKDNIGARQIIDMQVDAVQNSCGFGIPYYDYKGERESLTLWADKKGKEGVQEYWTKKNKESIDGKSIDI